MAERCAVSVPSFRQWTLEVCSEFQIQFVEDDPSRDRRHTEAAPLRAAMLQGGASAMTYCHALPTNGRARYVDFRKGVRRYEPIRPWTEARLPGVYDQVL